jgi:hypothetical protein
MHSGFKIAGMTLGQGTYASVIHRFGIDTMRGNYFAEGRTS